jgi:hypothetical protein
MTRVIHGHGDYVEWTLAVGHGYLTQAMQRSVRPGPIRLLPRRQSVLKTRGSSAHHTTHVPRYRETQPAMEANAFNEIGT